MKLTLRPSAGHILDIDSLEVNLKFLSLANNVNTRKGYPSRNGGRRVAYSGFGANALHLMNFTLNSFNWWLALKANSISARQGGTTFNISAVGQQTIQNPYEWSSGLLNGIPIFTNGRDPILFWDGDGGHTAQSIPDWPAGTTARALAVFRYHIFALNIENPSGVFENLVMWSDAAEPGTLPDSWTPAPDNEAGSTALSDTPGRCVCGVPLGSQLLVYKPAGIYAFEYVGQQPDNIFSNRPIVRSTGALSTHCVLEMGSRHLVVGNDDVILTDGLNVTSIAENRIKTFLSNTIDETNILNTFVIRDINRREVWICVPESGSQFATIAHIWDERRDTWVTKSLNNVAHGILGSVQDESVSDLWDDDAQPWDSDLNPWTIQNINSRPKIVLAEPTQLIVEDVFTPTDITATIQKLDLDFDDATQSKLTNRIWVYGTGSGMADIFVRLGSRNDIDDASPIAWGPYKPRQDNGTPYEVSGRYISVECQSIGIRPWTINRIVIEAEYNGSF